MGKLFISVVRSIGLIENVRNDGFASLRIVAITDLVLGELLRHSVGIRDTGLGFFEGERSSVVAINRNDEVEERDDGEFSDAVHRESPLAICFLGRAMTRASSFQYREYDELKEAANSDDVEQSNHFFLLFLRGTSQYGLRHLAHVLGMSFSRCGHSYPQRAQLKTLTAMCYDMRLINSACQGI